MAGPVSSAKKEPFAGLCASCTHAHRMENDRGSVFIRCELSFTDPAFAKYPRLPVLNCGGYESKAPQSEK